MTAPNTLPQPQGPPQGPPQPPLNPYQAAGLMPPAPGLQPANPNQQPAQPDPDEARGALTREAQNAHAGIVQTLKAEKGHLDEDLNDYKTATLKQLNQRTKQTRDYYDAIEHDPNIAQSVKDDARINRDNLESQFNSLYASYLNPADHEKHMETMLTERVDQHRAEYAKQLAARTDSTMAIASGRKGQVERAKFDYDVSVALLHNFKTAHLRAPQGADQATKERAALDRKKAIFELDFGRPGDDPETSMAEKFRLNRAERDIRKVRSGRFEVKEDGELRKDNFGQAVEKDPSNPFTKAFRGLQNKWNKWTEDARGEKWYSGKALVARGKKALVLGAGGAALGAAFGAVAGAAVGAGVALGGARTTKAIAGLKLNQGAERTQADAHFKKVATLLDKLRADSLDALNNKFEVSATGASVLASEIFSGRAHATHRRNLIGGSVGVGVSLVAGALAGEAVRGTFFGSDDVSAQSPEGEGKTLAEKARELVPDAYQDSEPQLPQTPESGPDVSQGPETPTPEGDTPEGSEPTEPSPHPDHEPQGGSTNPDTQPDTPDNGPGHDPDESQPQDDKNLDDQKKATEDAAKKAVEEAKEQPQQQGPQAPETEQPAPGEVKTVTPEQMKDKWVAEVYNEQLGEGGFQEMQDNAAAAMQAGDLEQVTKPNGTFYYQLTEQGAAKLPGAGTGSTTTYDVMRILASHSDKIDVA